MLYRWNLRKPPRASPDESRAKAAQLRRCHKQEATFKQGANKHLQRSSCNHTACLTSTLLQQSVNGELETSTSDAQ
eukprot:5102093-Amphidinium_carterae.2